jgi:hypothetical protein
MRQRLIDDRAREVTKRIGQRVGKIANPLKEGYEATRSAAEEFSQSGARLAQQLNSFIKKQKQRFFGYFKLLANRKPTRCKLSAATAKPIKQQSPLLGSAS